MKRRVSLFAFAVFMSFVSHMATANTTPPFPPNMSIVPPSPDTNPDLAWFSGVWTGGNWGGLLPNSFVVEKIDKGAVSVIYARGEQIAWKTGKPAWIRHTATYDTEKKQLSINFEGGGTVTYRRDGDRLSAVYVGDSAGQQFRTYTTELTRLDPFTAAAMPPLPADLKVVPTIGDAVAMRLSRIWRGAWGQIMPHTLVVERFEGSVAHVVYAFGQTPSWGITEGKWMRMTAEYNQGAGEIVVRFPSGASATYTLTSNGLLAGRYLSSRGAVSTGQFSPEN